MPIVWLRSFLQTSHRAIGALRIDDENSVAAHRTHLSEMLPRSCGLALPGQFCFSSSCIGIITVRNSERSRPGSTKLNNPYPSALSWQLAQGIGALSYSLSWEGGVCTPWYLVKLGRPHVYYGPSRCLPDDHPQQSGIWLCSLAMLRSGHNAHATPHPCAMCHSRDKKGSSGESEFGIGRQRTLTVRLIVSGKPPRVFCCVTRKAFRKTITRLRPQTPTQLPRQGTE